MAENKLTREIYFGYAKKIVSVLYGDEFFNQYKKRVENGYSDFKLVKKRLIQDISIDWISTIEDCLPNLDTIVRNPRKFIVQEEDIVDISLCKAISTESVKHLAQHTNMISKVDKDGTVTPSRILNITKEESFEIYENRFIYTLLLKLKDFVSIRYDKIKKASATQDVLQLNVDSKFNLPSKKVTYRTEFMAQLSFDEVMRMDNETLDKIERIAYIDKIITDFLASSFGKAMRNSAPVRPPITRTNVILKDPNFKKALTLWQFIETYQATGGFSTTDDIEDISVQNDSQEQLRQMVTLNTMLFESLYDQHETNMELGDAEFADLLRVGDLDFGKDEIQHDEYAQKVEEDEVDSAQNEEKPPEKEEGGDTDIFQDTPPKDEPEQLEPDVDKFDQNLFDVKKLYKQPEDNSLTEEEIEKVKDAIDRCLLSYRKIKQEILDQREIDEVNRRRQFELGLRADALNQIQEEREKQEAPGYYVYTEFVEDVPVKKKSDFDTLHEAYFGNKRYKLTNEEIDEFCIYVGLKEEGQEFEEPIAYNEEMFSQELSLLGKHKAEEYLGEYADTRAERPEHVEVEPVKFITKTASQEAMAIRHKFKPVVEEELEEPPTDEPMDGANGESTEEFDLVSTDETLSETNLGAGEEQGAEEIVAPETEVGVDELAGETVSKETETTESEEKAQAETESAETSTETAEEPATTHEEQNAKVGILANMPTSKPRKTAKGFHLPKGKKAKAVEEPAAEVQGEEVANTVEETPVDTPVEVQKEVEKPKRTLRRKAEPKDPWALSATTLNQKYDVASGKERTFKAVDENKVAVGDVNIKTEDDTTFGEQRAKLGNFTKVNLKSKRKFKKEALNEEVNETPVQDEVEEISFATPEEQKTVPVVEEQIPVVEEQVAPAVEEKLQESAEEKVETVAVTELEEEPTALESADETEKTAESTETSHSNADAINDTPVPTETAQDTSVQEESTPSNDAEQPEQTEDKEGAVGSTNRRYKKRPARKVDKHDKKKAEQQPEIATAQTETPQVEVEQKVEKEAETPVPEPPKPKKKSEPKDPWALSATTLNQKYDVASGKIRTFKAIDENKVAVGDVNIKSDEDITFGEQKAKLGNLTKPNAKTKRKANNETTAEEVSRKPQKQESDSNKE